MERSILMLEHDEDDRYITRKVFEEQRLKINLHFVSNADEFFQYLESNLNSRKHLPSIILMNYYIGPVTAMEVLKSVKSHAIFCKIPVIILSGTLHSSMIDECYQNGANSVIQKPWKADETDHKIQTFISYWFETVRLVS